MWGYASAFFGTLLISGAVIAAEPPHARPDTAALIKTEQTAMAPLAMMDGVWRGSAWTLLPSGEKHHITQTERIGPFLGGSVKVIEGRGYEPDGRVSFNALGTVSYNPKSKAYSMHSYALGYVGDFVFMPTKDGYSWDIPAGPVTMHYAAVIKDDHWHEVGDRVVPGQKPVRFFEMTLQRVGDTDWPAAGAITMKP